jgi:hypothetical protein
MRNTVFADGDELAVNNRIAFHTFERFRNFHVAVADDFAVFGCRA